MPRTAKVFMTNRSQAVRLPKEYHSKSIATEAERTPARRTRGEGVRQ